jgi:hypothetical protein
MKVNLTLKDLSLGQQTIQLLREVESGKRIFEPTANLPDALEGFQEQVKMLRTLETRRFILEINGLNMVRGVGRSVIDKVRLRGGLTEKGRALLAHHDGSQVGSSSPIGEISE